jgi:hypothetical protein
MPNPFEEGYEAQLVNRLTTGIKSIVQSVLEGINTLMSKENIEQKTRLSDINVVGAIEARTILTHQKDVYGNDGVDRVLASILEWKTVYAKSEEGAGIDDIVKLAHALVLNLKQEESTNRPDALQTLTGIK